MMKALSIFIVTGLNLLGCCGLLAQNNMIPNPGFETCSATSCIDGTSFGSSLSNWRMYVPCGGGLGCHEWEESHTQWILNSDPFKTTKYNNHSRNCSNSGQDKFILLGTQIFKEDQLHGGDDYDCDRIGIDNIAVALENGATFGNGTRYRIRYKVLPMPGMCSETSIYSDCENAVSPSCVSHVADYNLRIFLSKKGPNNWLDNNNDMEELINSNFSGTNPTVSGCDGWRVVDRVFTPGHSYYTTIGFMTHSGSFLLDDVEIFPACDDNYLIQNKVYDSNSNTSAFYQTNAVDGYNFVEWAGSYLTAGSNVGAANATGPVLVDDQSNITYKAGVNVTLRDNFRAQKGCFFRAAIESCPQSRGENPDVTDLVGSDLKRHPSKNSAQNGSDAPAAISVFPNPFSTTVMIKCSLLSAGVKIRITNAISQLVAEYTSTAGQNAYEVEAGKFAPGIYFVSVYNTQGTAVSTTKIVKQ